MARSKQSYRSQTSNQFSNHNSEIVCVFHGLKNCIGRKVVQEELTSKHDNYKRVMEKLFNDPAWVKQNINQRDLNHKLYEMAGAIQGTELRGKVSLYDLFTQDELYDNWVVSNSWWQMSYGNSPYTGNVQPYSQRNLLRDIIEKADSCIALPHPLPLLPLSNFYLSFKTQLRSFVF